MEINKFGMTFKKLLYQAFIFFLMMIVLELFWLSENPDLLKILTGVSVGSIIYLAFMCWMYEVNPFKKKLNHNKK
ncbi:hypothetical protein MM236_06170 [Belliella sp. DSM 107340]|uniref:Uncharacterized protein n=1 Tax=Belliella calami TaxID=2923436 RepID=A0ABS9ULR7_9BACT|nr:hypothetical protein [Belliella calami]MCH7397564.1 hypothetical protein [Belliella calami]